MSKTFIGLKPGVGPVLKVMENAADDPLTTPNSDFAKFRFNSENRDYAYIKSIRRIDAGTPGWEGNRFRWENQSFFNSFGDPAAAWAQQEQKHQFYDVVFVNSSTGRQSDRGWYKYQNSPARYRSKIQMEIDTAITFSSSGFDCVHQSYFIDHRNQRNIGYFLLVEWALPARVQTRPRAPIGIVNSGARVLELSTTRASLAAPGYDVRTATPDQMIFSELRTPIGCIASGVTTLSGTSGSVAVQTIPGANYFVDLQWNTPGETRRYPFFLAQSNDIQMECIVSGGSLQFFCEEPNATVTYHVYAFGEGTPNLSAPLRVRATPEAVSIWRGNESGPVNYRDIIFDSRLKYPTVFSDQSWQDPADGSGSFPGVFFSFQNLGYIPIVKAAGSASFFNGGFLENTITRFGYVDNVGNNVGFEALVSANSFNAILNRNYGSYTQSGVPLSFSRGSVRMFALTI
jgi:hypothetical protein